MPRFYGDEVLKPYFNEIEKYPPLTKEEQIELGRRISNGDREALTQLINSNLRFVISVAKKYIGRGLQLGDLINEGNIGLIEAASKYNYKRGTNFNTFAVWHIKQKIIRAIYDKSRIIRISANKNLLLNKIKSAEKELTSKKSRIPSLDEIADYLKIPCENIRKVLLTNEVYSFDSVYLRDERENSEESAFYNRLRQDVMNVLYSLSEKERGVIQKRFGINGYRKMSLEEVSRDYHLTRERIRQIQKKAIIKLRRKRAVKILREYLK